MKRNSTIAIILFLFSLVASLSLTASSSENPLQKGGDSSRISDLLEHGEVYSKQDFNKAYSYFRKASILAKEQKDIEKYADCLHQIAQLYLGAYKYEKSIELNKEAVLLYRELGSKHGEMIAVYEIGEACYQLSAFSDAIKYFQEAYEISIVLNEVSYQMQVLSNLGALYSQLGEYDKAIKLFNRALLKVDAGIDSKNSMLVFMNIGNAYFYIADYAKAVSYYQKALNISMLLEQKEYEALLLDALANIQCNLDNNDEALLYYQKSLEISVELSDLSKSLNTIKNIGNQYEKMGNDSLALAFFEKGLRKSIQSRNRREEASFLYCLGRSLLKQKAYLKSVSYVKSAIYIHEAIHQQKALASDYFVLSNAYMEMGGMMKALEAAQQSLSLREQIKDLKGQLSSHKQLSELYSQTTNFEQALNHYKAYKLLNDDIFSAQKVRDVAIKELQYRVNQERELERIEQQKREESFQADVAQQKLIRNLFFGAFLLMGLLVLVVLRSYLVKRRVNWELRKKNLQIKLKNEHIAAQSQSKDILYSVISHDLKNPFIALMSFSDLLVSGFGKLPEDQFLSYLRVMNKTTHEGYYLLENLLFWTATQLNKIRIVPVRLNMSALTKRTLLLMANAIDQKKIVIHNRVPSGCFAYADENTIATALRNLLTNAIKYSHEKGQVELLISQKLDFIEYTIKDNGIGINNTTLEHVFSLSNKTTSVDAINEKGTGLGLNLSKEFVERNGGSFSIESIEGEGTLVVFTLPLDKREVFAASEVKEESSMPVNS